MEQEWFSWQDWDGSDDILNFYSVTLKKQIGQYKKGSKFSSVSILLGIDGESKNGVIQLYKAVTPGGAEEVLVAQFKLHFIIGEQILP